MEILKKNKKIVVVIALVAIFMIGVFMFFYYRNSNDNNVSISNFYNDDMLNLDYQGNEGNGVGKGAQHKGENSDNENQNGKSDVSNEEELIYVHIVGEINSEGIITLKKGQRIVDAIEKAGGVTDSADLSKVNLAFVLSDGQKIKIPGVNDSYDDIKDMQYITSDSGSNVIVDNGYGTKGSDDMNNKVNINTATQTELETLKGVGPSLADNIIQYRKQNGKFKNLEELRNVTGIGDAKFEQIKNNVTV